MTQRGIDNLFMVMFSAGAWSVILWSIEPWTWATLFVTGLFALSVIGGAIWIHFSCK